MVEGRRARGRRLAKLALLLASLVVGLAVAEVAARYYVVHLADDAAFRAFASLDQLKARSEDPTRPVNRYESHRLIGYVPTPDFRSGDDRHNALGFRGPEIPQPKPQGEFRIVCLGGSTTYTNFVDDDELSYPAQLERHLHEAGYEHVRVVNAGAAGYASFESLANLQFRVLDLDPDMIIVYHAVNDVIHRMIWPPRAYRSDDSGFLTHAPGLSVEPPLPMRSTLVRMLLVSTGLAVSPLDLVQVFGTASPHAIWWEFERQVTGGRYPASIFRKAPPRRIFRANPPTYFRRNLESMIQIARGQGIQPVLATFAHRHYLPNDTLSQPEIRSEINAHNRLIQEIGLERDVPVFDFASVFPNDEENLWVGAVHVGPLGAQLKGRLFADHLIGQQLIPSREALLEGQASAVSRAKDPAEPEPRDP